MVSNPSSSARNAISWMSSQRTVRRSGPNCCTGSTTPTSIRPMSGLPAVRPAAPAMLFLKLTGSLPDHRQCHLSIRVILSPPVKEGAGSDPAIIAR